MGNSECHLPVLEGREHFSRTWDATEAVIFLEKKSEMKNIKISGNSRQTRFITRQTRFIRRQTRFIRSAKREISPPNVKSQVREK